MKNALYVIIIMFLVGCDTLNVAKEPKSPIDVGLLDGNWRGAFYSDLATGNMRCNLKGSLWLHISEGFIEPGSFASPYRFKEPVRYDGYVKFTFKNAVRITRLETFTNRTEDMIFTGWIGRTRGPASKEGGGTWQAGNCHGTWEVYHTSN